MSNDSFGSASVDFGVDAQQRGVVVVVLAAQVVDIARADQRAAVSRAIRTIPSLAVFWSAMPFFWISK